MPDHARIGGFTAGSFLLAMVLFNPPFLLIFDHARLVAGLPLLYVYLFAAWFLVILLAALIVEFHTRDERIEESANSVDVGDPESHRTE